MVGMTIPVMANTHFLAIPELKNKISPDIHTAASNFPSKRKPIKSDRCQELRFFNMRKNIAAEAALTSHPEKLVWSQVRDNQPGLFCLSGIESHDLPPHVGNAM